MANGKTLQRLHNEVRRHPAKAVALGLLVVTALWFWLPHVVRFGGNESAAVPKPAVSAATPARPEGTNASKPDVPTAPQWRHVRQWIANDPNMQPAELPHDARNPFSNAEVVKNGAPQVSEVTPAQAGITLTSTIVGRQRRTALLDGRAYQEGQTIPAPKSDIRFQLVEIQPRYVVLEHQGKRYKLKLPSVDVAGMDD